MHTWFHHNRKLEDTPRLITLRTIWDQISNQATSTSEALKGQGLSDFGTFPGATGFVTAGWAYEPLGRARGDLAGVSEELGEDRGHRLPR